MKQFFITVSLIAGCCVLSSCKDINKPKQHVENELDRMGANLGKGALDHPVQSPLSQKGLKPFPVSRRPGNTTANTPPPQLDTSNQRTAARTTQIQQKPVSLGAQWTTVNTSNFQSLVKDPNRLHVVVFHATWCGPCKRMKPEMQRAGRDVPSTVSIAYVDIDQQKKLASQYGVRSIPDVRLFKGGRQIGGFKGGRNYAFLKKEITKYAPKTVNTAVRGLQRPQQRSSVDLSDLKPLSL